MSTPDTPPRETRRRSEASRIRSRQSESEWRIRSAVKAMPASATLEVRRGYPGINLIAWGVDLDDAVNYFGACQPIAIRELLAELNRLRRMVP